MKLRTDYFHFKKNWKRDIDIEKTRRYVILTSKKQEDRHFRRLHQKNKT